MSVRTEQECHVPCAFGARASNSSVVVAVAVGERSRLLLRPNQIRVSLASIVHFAQRRLLCYIRCKSPPRKLGEANTKGVLFLGRRHGALFDSPNVMCGEYRFDYELAHTIALAFAFTQSVKQAAYVAQGIAQCETIKALSFWQLHHVRSKQ